MTNAKGARIADLPPDLARHLFDMGLIAKPTPIPLIRTNPEQARVVLKQLKGTWYERKEDVPF